MIIFPSRSTRAELWRVSVLVLRRQANELPGTIQDDAVIPVR